eukprot:37988_1
MGCFSSVPLEHQNTQLNPPQHQNLDSCTEPISPHSTAGANKPKQTEFDDILRAVADLHSPNMDKIPSITRRELIMPRVVMNPLHFGETTTLFSQCPCISRVAQSVWNENESFCSDFDPQISNYFVRNVCDGVPRKLDNNRWKEYLISSLLFSNKSSQRRALEVVTQQNMDCIHFYVIPLSRSHCIRNNVGGPTKSTNENESYFLFNKNLEEYLCISVTDTGVDALLNNDEFYDANLMHLQYLWRNQGETIRCHTASFGHELEYTYEIQAQGSGRIAMRMRNAAVQMQHKEDKQEAAAEIANNGSIPPELINNEIASELLTNHMEIEIEMKDNSPQQNWPRITLDDEDEETHSDEQKVKEDETEEESFIPFDNGYPPLAPQDNEDSKDDLLLNKFTEKATTSDVICDEINVLKTDDKDTNEAMKSKSPSQEEGNTKPQQDSVNCRIDRRRRRIRRRRARVAKKIISKLQRESKVCEIDEILELEQDIDEMRLWRKIFCKA